jgi:predicted O-methyltransferase YrrM
MEATIEIAVPSKSQARSILLLFAPTIFLSASLLFWFEPMVGKMMLPLLGGAASVWITCLLFFQLMLLAGYGYAHVLERYANVRTQILVHIVLMLSAVIFLPVHFTVRPDASASSHPTLWLMGMLIRFVGVPFCLVSTTAPLLQNWLSKTTTASGRDPYFLYAVSNAGSLLALLAYPLWIEPKWGVHVQSSAWAIAYGLLVILVVIAAGLVWRHLTIAALGGAQAQQRAASSEDRTAPAATAPTVKQRMFWLGAAFVPSGLMLAVTNHMLLNLASVPFLWVMPLAIYLVTFMIAFARRLRISPRVLSFIVPIILLALLPLVAVSRPVGSHSLWYVLGSHMLVLFAGALLCHTALASRRPDTSHLTEFYFWVALGGALGGIFVAVIAPFVFSTVIEYPLLVAMVALFRQTRETDQRLSWGDWIYPAAAGLLVAAAWYSFKWASVDVLEDMKSSLAVDAVLILFAFLVQKRRIRFALTFAVLIAGYRLALPGFLDDYETLRIARDFFGIKKVVFDLDSNMRKLLHGDTLHGLESQDPALNGVPLSYYHETGPVGDVMHLLSTRPNQHVAVVGLGTGTMAGWFRPNRHITFFDIDPQVYDISYHFFTYLRRCGSDCDVVIGDGRLSLEKTAANEFDLIMLDAFNSDSIPAHLVSREAVRMYVQKLKPNGLILFHVSNRYMDVESLVSAVAFDTGLEGRVRFDEDEEPTGKTGSDYVIVAKRTDDFGELKENENWTPIEKPAEIQPWTDDYSNMMAIVRWR